LNNAMVGNQLKPLLKWLNNLEDEYITVKVKVLCQNRDCQPMKRGYGD